MEETRYHLLVIDFFLLSINYYLNIIKIFQNYYSIANWSPKLKQESVIKEMERAFKAWTDYSRLNFQNVNDPNADIIISFSQGSHGDGYIIYIYFFF